MHWLVKATAQNLLAVMPGGEAINFRLQRRDGPRFLNRIESGIRFLEDFATDVSIRDQRILEIGTGWDCLHTLLLAAAGARAVTTFDHVRHARWSAARLALVALSERAERLCRLAGCTTDTMARRLADWHDAPSLPGMFERAGIDYRAPADASATGLPARSIDVVYSHLVLSFVRATELEPMFRELHRVLRPAGRSIHRIALSDPYAPDKGGDLLHYLTIPDRLWQALCDNDIQRNNRWRAGMFMKLLSRTGHRPIRIHRRMNAADLARVRGLRIARSLRHLPAEELAITGVDLVYEPMPSPGSDETTWQQFLGSEPTDAKF